MRKLSNTEADLKKSVAYKKSVYFAWGRSVGSKPAAKYPPKYPTVKH